MVDVVLDVVIMLGVLAGSMAAPGTARAETAPSPRLLVLQKHAELLSGFDPETGDRWGSTIRIVAIPHEIAATADGNCLLITNYGVKTFRDTDPGANLITIVDPHRIAHAGTIDLGENHRPHGIVRGRSGRFYVTTDMPAALLVIDADQRSVVTRYPLDQKLPHMVEVTADEHRAFVANAGSGTISGVPIDTPPATAKLQAIAIGGTPMGLALTDDGHWLYAYRKEFHFAESMTPAWLASDEGRRVTATVLSFQTPSGGWSKHVDLLGRPRKPGESFYSENDGWRYIATLDNDATTEQIRFVAAAAAATGDAAARASFGKGLDYLLAAQFPNGCWPQVYPLEGGYHDAITFNDDAILNVMRLLDDVAAGRVNVARPEQQRRARAAAARGLKCIVATQVADAGARTIWAQQNDPLTRAPVPARRYELAGLASRESANLVAYLMTLPSPSADVVETVHAATHWFGSHAIKGYDYDARHGLRADPNGGPIWARLTELDTARPIFSNRDGVKRYDWNELTDRRYGYTWYCHEPATVLTTYATWSKQHVRAP